MQKKAVGDSNSYKIQVNYIHIFYYFNVNFCSTDENCHKKNHFIGFYIGKIEYYFVKFIHLWLVCNGVDSKLKFKMAPIGLFDRQIRFVENEIFTMISIHRMMIYLKLAGL